MKFKLPNRPRAAQILYFVSWKVSIADFFSRSLTVIKIFFICRSDTEDQHEVPNQNTIASEEDIQIEDKENLPFSPEINT